MPPASTSPAFKNPQALLYHGGAVAYALLAYAIGIAGVHHPGLLIPKHLIEQRRIALQVP